MKFNSYKHRFAPVCMALAIAAGSISSAVAKEGGSRSAESEYQNIFLGEVSPTNYAEDRSELGVIGEVEIVRERYADGKVRIERQTTLNGDGNYVNHGAWKQFSKTGDVVAEGQYNFGQPAGAWTRWIGINDSPIFKDVPFKQFKPPFMSQATFAEGKMEGDWVITDANERKVAIVTLKAGRRDGMTTIWLPNGTVFRQMTYHDSVPVGESLEINPKTGELVKAGSYDDGRKVVTRTERYPHGKQVRSEGKQVKSEIMYLAAKTVMQSPDDYWNTKLATYKAEGEDLRNGVAKTWYSNGQAQQEGAYHNGKKVGTFTYWHANGQIATTGEYRDNQPEGNWVWYHDNGQKSAVGRYEHGKLIGDWRWWDEQGKLTKQQTYNGTESAATETEERIDVSMRSARGTQL
jgi:antitoxin component YwqK of YwqJK toxin-antitoxin module